MKNQSQHGTSVLATKKIRPVLIALALAAMMFNAGCDSDNSVSLADESQEELSTEMLDADFETPDWTEATHSKDADPDFDEVFDDSQVKRLDVVVTEEHWQSMLDDMTSNYGEFGRRSNAAFSDENPIFVPADIYYNEKQWYRVGVRFKGNSSLQSSWSAGILKLSLKLDFDEFESDYPQIDNQRFYGFKKLSLKNNFDDSSFIREKMAADVFRDAGMAVSHTAFYTLYIDHGNGPQYFGLYTLVEEVDDTVLDEQFVSDDGNLYKPDGVGADFVAGTFTEAAFEKKTNEDDEDWTDIQALFSALHNSSVDAATWRSNLESVFDVEQFLTYLAVNGVIQNWDTYGQMTHNYFLYNNPETGLLTWIPWDNNEALQEGKRGGALALDFSNLESGAWPLIENVIADETYKARYDELVSEVVSSTGAFESSKAQAAYINYSALIEPYATSELPGYTFLRNAADFYTAVDELELHADQRATAVQAYISSQ